MLATVRYFRSLGAIARSLIRAEGSRSQSLKPVICASAYGIPIIGQSSSFGLLVASRLRYCVILQNEDSRALFRFVQDWFTATERFSRSMTLTSYRQPYSGGVAAAASVKCTIVC